MCAVTFRRVACHQGRKHKTIQWKEENQGVPVTNRNMFVNYLCQDKDTYIGLFPFNCKYRPAT